MTTSIDAIRSAVYRFERQDREPAYIIVGRQQYEALRREFLKIYPDEPAGPTYFLGLPIVLAEGVESLYLEVVGKPGASDAVTAPDRP